MNKLLVLLLFLGLFTNAQSKKQIKANNIKQITSYNYITKLGKTYKIKDNYHVYNEKGYLIKEVEYNKEGKLKYVKKYYYNSDNDKIKEESFDSANKLKKTTLYEYKDGLKISKKVLDYKGNLISKKEYEYVHY